MIIDLSGQILIFEQYSDGYKESYPFKMIDDVRESDFQLEQHELGGISSDFSSNFFKIKLKPSTVKHISASCQIDRN